MRLQWHPEAVQEFLKLETQVQKYLNRNIEKLPEKGIKWEKVGRVKRDKISLDAYKIKLNPKDREEINHRIVFDIDEGDYKIAKVGKRPNFYGLENLEEAKKRI